MKLSDHVSLQGSWQRSCNWIVFAGLTLLVLFAAVRSPLAQTWLLVAEDKNFTLLKEAEQSSERSWNTWTTRAAEWEVRRAIGDEEDQRNWAGRQMMRKQRAADSLWWDKRAEQSFISKLEESQFPANCSQAHWIAHYEHRAASHLLPYLWRGPEIGHGPEIDLSRNGSHIHASTTQPSRHPANPCNLDCKSRRTRYIESNQGCPSDSSLPELVLSQMFIGMQSKSMEFNENPSFLLTLNDDQFENGLVGSSAGLRRPHSSKDWGLPSMLSVDNPWSCGACADSIDGLLSTVHQLLLPLFFAMVRGHPLVPMSLPTRHPAFDGCGTNITDRNVQCYFNVTNCRPVDDESRLSQILAQSQEILRTTWDEVLMETDDFFPESGVTVTETYKRHAWETTVCVGSSPFSSFWEAYSYQKFSLFEAMGRHGKVGVITDNSTRASKNCSGNQQEGARTLRVDMVMVSLMSSWMLNQMHSNVKLVADEIMSRYEDSSGQPLWKPPVLAIHIRQTDKKKEDPYFIEHGKYRPIESYALHMTQMEEYYSFEWPTIFIISDSGTARESLVAILNEDGSTEASGNSTASIEPQDKKRFIMYDWIADDHLQEKFDGHAKVPEYMKHDMQIHFLATLYILQKISDHAIVTYSSNVGRFIGEIMAAQHRLAFVDSQGPLVTSLDGRWFWA